MVWCLGFYRHHIRKQMKIEKVREIFFKQHGDERGHLVVAEGLKDIPFEIKRIFYIYDSDSNIIRGNHANLKSEFVLINAQGSSKVRVKDGVGGEHIYILDQPHMGLYLPRMVWKEMYDFSKNSLLLVLASENYDAEEYIRNYDEFQKIVRENEETNQKK